MLVSELGASLQPGELERVVYCTKQPSSPPLESFARGEQRLALDSVPARTVGNECGAKPTSGAHRERQPKG